jgi:hypothetical protein
LARGKVLLEKTIRELREKFELASVWAVKGGQIIHKANSYCEMADIDR